MKIEVRIEDVGFGGAGVGRIENQVVFVPFTIDDERVIVQITERHRNFLRGAVVEVSGPSPHRTQPACPLFAQCGGCDYQHMTYEHQLVIKRRQVESALGRISKMPETKVLPAVPSPKPFGFRNRITVHSDGKNIGFFKKRSRSIIDVKHCPIASDPINAQLAQLRSQGLRKEAHRTLRENAETRTFSQTNDQVASLLQRAIEPHLLGTTLVDAYCGSGFFSHAFAPRFERVIGIEWSEPAIEAARKAARRNETYLAGDVKAVLPGVLEQHRPELVLLDPPASGLEPEVVTQLLERPPQRLIYVSCDPSTLARDLDRMSEKFQPRYVQPFDMFPQTAEIEVLAVMENTRVKSG